MASSVYTFPYGSPLYNNTSEHLLYEDRLLSFDDPTLETPAVPQIHSVPDAVVGFVPIIQNFYEGPERCDCCINWTEKPLVQIPESEVEKYERAAIRVYRCKDHEKRNSRVGGLIAVRYDRIIVQSRQLIDLIQPTLEVYGTKIPEKGNLEFLHPFKDLYFSYTTLMKLSRDYPHHSDEAALLRLLEEIMKSMFAEFSLEVSRHHSAGTINYECLWTLFRRGTVVYHRHHGAEALLRVINTEPAYATHIPYAPNPYKANEKRRTEIGLRVHCEFVSFDGTNFGAVKQSFLLEKSDAEQQINSLEVYPLAFHLDKSVRAKCTDRGRALLNYQSTAHCAYNGTATRISADNETSFVTGRVVVDPFYFNIRHPNTTGTVELLDDGASDGARGSNNRHDLFGMQSSVSHTATKLPTVGPGRRPSQEDQQLNYSFLEARPHLLMIATPFVPGFSLKHNQWFNFDISELHDITWMNDPLENWVFDSDIKQMLTSFTRHHITTIDSASGPLAMKGQGLVVLLSGPSGTGKTLTAEVIAEETRKPLYRIMAGHSESTPAGIEQVLETGLEMAAEWNAVVLIDDVDTFVRSRTSGDFSTNGIVSIFLRRLEYFSGIVFLTTSMPQDIDTAFRSRCRLDIIYPSLTAASRRKIWRLNLVKAGFKNTCESLGAFELDQPLYEAQRHKRSDLSLMLYEDDMDEIEKWQLSGREIQNVVQNVALWCKTDTLVATKERFNVAMRMTVPDAMKDGDQIDPMDSPTDVEDRPRKRPRLTVTR